MDRELIHSEIISILKALKKDRADECTSTRSIVEEIKRKVREDFRLPDEDIINEEIHLLLINNVLMRAGRWGELYPVQHLKLTEYGKKCIEDDSIVPLDPLGYLEQIKTSLPQIDSVIFDYLSESITAFNRNLILSSTITLGVASERAMLLLIENFCKFIENSNLKGYIRKLIDQRFISQKYDTLKEALEKLPKEIKKEFPDNYEITIDTMFNFIKINRDATGHPKGGGKDKLIQSANLQAFKSYLTAIYKLIDHFESKKL